MSENKWIYNTNEELWMNCGSYDAKEEAIKAGKEEFEGNRHQFFVGQIKNMDIGVGVDADNILDNISENVRDEVGEAADDYLSYVHKEHLSELEEQMNAVLREWMDRHDYYPKYFRVANVECISLEE